MFTGVLFLNIFSVRVSLHRKHILAFGGLTEWHNHAKTAQPLPSANATKRHCSAGLERGPPGTICFHFSFSAIPNPMEVAVNSKRFQFAWRESTDNLICS